MRNSFWPVFVVWTASGSLPSLHWNDRQARDQAVLVARHNEVDRHALQVWAEGEGAAPAIVDEVRRDAKS